MEKEQTIKVASNIWTNTSSMTDAEFAHMIEMALRGNNIAWVDDLIRRLYKLADYGKTLEEIEGALEALS